MPIENVHATNLLPSDDSVDMDEVSKTEDTDVDEDGDKEPDSTLGEESDIDEDADSEPDSELDDKD